MAYDYEKTKQAYQGMTREQQQQFVNQNQNDASFQRFMGDYMNEINGKSQKATPVQNNEQKPLQQNSEQKPLQQQQQDEVVTNKNQYAPEEFKNQNNQQFDPNEKLQTQMFQTPANDKVVVKEGTAQQTGTPDYQLDSDARNKEITDNLNYYWQNNPDYFKDRATYNSIFHYDERSEGQKAILDSYWKKKDLQDSTIKYGTGDSIVQGMNDIDITEDQLNYIKANNEGAYREWQAKQQEMIDRIISNQSVPTVDEIVNKLTDYIDKLDLGSQRYDFMQYNEELKQQYQIDSKLSALEETIANMKSDKAKIDSVITKYSNAGADTMGGAAANFARMQRALAPYNESFAKNAQIYSAQLQSYQMSAAQVKSDLNVMYQQTQEDQRVFNNKLQALGFAMKVDSYRTPEQQMNLRLQEQYQSGQISLLQQSQQNDLNRYNQYATAKMQNELQFELTDLNVSDPEQAKRNLNNILSQYYSQYGDIIKRSQSQTLQDVLDYAKKNGVSIAEALTENFIKPLQSKDEYKAKVAAAYGTDKYQQQYSYTIDEDGKVSMKVSGYGDAPQLNFSSNSSRDTRVNSYKDVYQNSTSWQSYVQNLANQIKDGSWGGQCGAFINDILVAGGQGKIFGNSLEDKIKSCNVKVEEGAEIGYAVVLDTGATYKDEKGNTVPAGHVAIITDIKPNGDVEVLESNGDGGKTVRTHIYNASSFNNMVKGYYKPENFSTFVDDTEYKPRENNPSTQTGNIKHTSWGDYDVRYADDFLKILTNAEGKTFTDKDKAILIEQIGGADEYYNQLNAFKKEKENEQNGLALDVLKTIQEFEEMGGNNRGWGIFKIDPQEKAKFQQLEKKLQLLQLFNAKSNGATFGAMSDSEWAILKDAASSISWNQQRGFNSELNNIKNTLWTAAFGNSNYSEDNWEEWKKANPTGSTKASGGNNGTNQTSSNVATGYNVGNSLSSLHSN